MKSVGIYGGTFSPPHLGHLNAAKKFKDAFSLDELLIIPTFIPPHKQRTESTSPEDRLAMCRLSFAEIQGALISDIEIQRQGKSYTSDTLRYFTSSDARLYFLCGTDMFLTLESWHEPEVIFALADIVYISRELDEALAVECSNKTNLYREKYGARIHFLPADAVVLSSSEIREARKCGEEWKDKIVPEVADYIERKGLYL